MSDFVLSTGRSFYANNGILGLDEDLNLYGGYDGKISLENYSFDSDSMLPEFKPEEITEIADIMITRWQAFKRKHGAGKSTADICGMSIEV